MEITSYGGNSGSPVFFYLEGIKTPGALALGGKETFKLAGIMQGFFKEAVPPGNSGIAAVVPAYKLREVLFGAELTATKK